LTKAAGIGVAQIARQTQTSGKNNFFTNAQVARAPRQIQGKWHFAFA
jgi:hypothetical protein